MAKTDTDIRFEIVKTNKSLLGTTDISNGCVYFVDDTKELFFDFDSKRSEVKDILVLEKESERTSILFVPLNKFYFVLETKILWFYKDGSWYQVSQSAPPSADPSSVTIADLSKISTGLSISTIDNKVVVSSGHVVDSTATKVLRLDSPMTKTLSTFVEGNGNGGMSTFSGDLIPTLTSNADTGLIYGAGSTGYYVQPYFVFNKNEDTTYFYQIYSGINESYSSYVGYEFSNIKPAGNYSIKYIAKSDSSSGTTEVELYILTTEGNKELVYQKTDIDSSWQTISASISIDKSFTTIYVANDSNSNITRIAEFYIYAESSNIQNIYIISKDNNTTDICIGDNIPSSFIYQKQIGKIILNEDSTKIVDFLPKIDLTTLYTNNELATKDDIKTTVNITYSELVDLKSNSKLESGVYYRITDYVTTTNGASANSSEPSRSAGHQFDVIIQALGPSDLAEIGTCTLHEGDTYFAGQNVSGWQIWYHLENDKTKYQWADTVNGKGVIYRMIDERNNDFPYDFKNIQFYRDSTLGKYSAVKARLVAEDGYYYTMTDTTNGITDFSMASNDNTNNKMLPTIINSSNNAFNLNNTIFLQYTGTRNVQNNTFGMKCHNNTFLNISNNSILQGYFQNNVLGANFHYNRIGGYFQNNITTGDFADNFIMDYFQNNTISQGFISNIIGANFGNNTTSAGFLRNYIGALVQYCNFGSYFYYNSMLGATQYIKTPSGTKSSRFMNNIINTLNGTSSALIDLTGLPMGQKYNVNVSTDINNKIIATWNEFGTTKGKYKESASSIEWLDLVPEYYTTTEIDTKLGDISTILDSLNGEVQ